MNCGECKHWTPNDGEGWKQGVRLALKEGEQEDDRYEPGSPLHERQVEVEKSYGKCAEIGLLDSYAQVDGDDLPLAFTRDASDYVADLYTLAEFGCLSFERTNDSTRTRA